jgi:hypothetical protein
VVGTLDTVADWRREIGRMFREARAGTLPSDEAARMSYIAQLGVRVAQIEEELQRARAIAEALQQRGIDQPALAFHSDVESLSGDVAAVVDATRAPLNGHAETSAKRDPIEAQP